MKIYLIRSDIFLPAQICKKTLNVGIRKPWDQIERAIRKFGKKHLCQKLGKSSQ